mmetsp:Transcript_21665/g.38380  ORF Transcript_21665/g.38380 Transcript_21665/m.38380 type:complete len:319 (-) Transcript_21665:147-1103(-)|eukprot:CAMPEP_0171497544 /NCGR_PEP_ID=MMETSP0958-20121227/7335_1 /TAXON_ID=87120 /ORGANISM="Aurantiochytrium limacinum, Strain ATCCMYA-1381" /LENGTH=318 /DNA_ID=CAMNT_0012031807 /DNA_START=120 /DNA_END=1076 /DNA_ORIENTATION=-
MGIKGKYKDHIVAITGAAQGIGRELALQLAKNGCGGLALSDFNAKALEETAKEIGDLCPVSTTVCDVRNVRDLETFRDDAIRKHGRVSVIINNAGVATLGDFEDQSKDEFDRVMDINFGAVVNSTRIFLPLLKREKESHLVNICSMYGYFASAGNSSYHTSKFALRGFNETLVAECIQNCPQVKVHSVHPGFIRTQLVQNAHISSKATREEALEMFKQIGLTDADQAAITILEGVARNQFRIRVGPDAYMLDYLARLLPGTYLTNPRFGHLCVIYCSLSSALAAKLRDYLRLGEATSLVAVVIAQYMVLRRILRIFIG